MDAAELAPADRPPPPRGADAVRAAGRDGRRGSRITDADGEVILDRQAGAAPADAPVERHPIVIEGETVGWVEGAAAAPGRSPRCSPTPAPARPTSAPRPRGARSLPRAEPDLRPGRARSARSSETSTRSPRSPSPRPAGCRPAGPASCSSPTDGERLAARRRTACRSAPARRASAAATGILGAILGAASPRSSTTSPADPRATAAERAFASLDRRAAPGPRRADRRDRHDLDASRIEYHAARPQVLAAIASLAGPDVRPGRGPRAGAPRVAARG